MEAQTAERLTVSEHEQYMVAGHVRQIYDFFLNLPHNTQSLMLEIQRDEHMEYLIKGLRRLGPSFCVLDANRPWLCYWILHSIALLAEYVDAELKRSAIDFLSRCQDPNGGYGGGPGQMPHLATTYAAVNALITLGGRKSLSSINRHGLYMFLRRMKDPCGGFRMHDEGEIDVRACYTAISVASVLNILDDELVQNVGNYILSCQTYEGGIAGEPGSEAHGGYTFCGLATMILINEADRLDLDSLIDWVVFRQGVECGFQGRTNKLVDGCYSFWQGGSVALIQKLLSIVDERVPLSDAGHIDCTTDSPQAGVTFDSSEEEEVLDGTSSLADDTCHIRQEGSQDASVPDNLNNIGNKYAKGCAKMEPLFNSMALQQYILLCSQVQEGGFRDKPGKSRDYYHTCYCLSGLSVSQYSWAKDEDSPPSARAVLGPYCNLLEATHPLFNVVLDRYHEAHDFFTRF